MFYLTRKEERSVYAVGYLRDRRWGALGPHRALSKLPEASTRMHGREARLRDVYSAVYSAWVSLEPHACMNHAWHPGTQLTT